MIWESLAYQFGRSPSFSKAEVGGTESFGPFEFGISDYMEIILNPPPFLSKGGGGFSLFEVTKLSCKIYLGFEFEICDLETIAGSRMTIVLQFQEHLISRFSLESLLQNVTDKLRIGHS
jgi:hypothetical protein